MKLLKEQFYMKLQGEECLKDVQNGFVSIEKAKEDYGVVIDPLTFQVDEEETRKLRGQ